MTPELLRLGLLALIAVQGEPKYSAKLAWGDLEVAVFAIAGGGFFAQAERELDPPHRPRRRRIAEARGATAREALLELGTALAAREAS
jgi:hypothetical protein